MIFELPRRYLYEIRRGRDKYSRELPRFLELVYDFPFWLESQNDGKNSLSNERAWIPFAAHRFLGRLLNKKMRVYEYGAGGSTLFFAKRAAEVISVEHDPAWAEEISQVLKKKGYRNARVNFIEAKKDVTLPDPDPTDPDGYVSGAPEFKGYSFRDYAESIDSFPDGTFDLIMIDGRARPSCFKHAEPKLKKHGYLILDNSERPEYIRANEALQRPHWERMNFWGPGPYASEFWSTTICQKLYA